MCFHSPKQVCLTQLHQMCLIQEIHQDVCLALTGPDGKYGGLVVLPFQASAKHGCFLGTQKLTWPESIILASI